MLLPNLTTERCLIRLAEPRDVDDILRYWTENGVRYSPALPTQRLTRDYWEARMLMAYKEHLDGVACKLYVFSGARVIGTVMFNNILRGLQHQSTLGYGIAASHEGQGFMSEAVERAIQYAFEELGIHRIEASYRPTNTRSERLLKRLGFEREGVLRDALWVDGAWETQILMARLNSSWSLKA